MNKLRFNQIVLSICACWASTNSELGIPLSRQLRFVDSLTLLWSFVILCTSLAKYLAEDLALNLTRDANFSSRSEPTMRDLLTINYLPRINEFSKLYYGLMSVSIGTSHFWRLYLRFYRPRFAAAVSSRNSPCTDAKSSLMRFFYDGPPIVSLEAAASPSRPPSTTTTTTTARAAAQAEAEASVPEARTTKNSLADSSSILTSAAHLEWLKLFECRAVIKDLSGCCEELVRSFRLDSANRFAHRLNPLSTLHGKMIQRKLSATIGQNETSISAATAAAEEEDEDEDEDEDEKEEGPREEPPLREKTMRRQQEQQQQDHEQTDIFLNPVRSHNFLEDYTWARWRYISRNLNFMLLLMTIMTVPILYYTIVGLYSVMINFSYETLDTRLKLTLYCYGVFEQVYSCTQAALFFIFTNIFITIFHADIQYKMDAIEGDLRAIHKAIQEADQQQQQQSRVATTNSSHSHSSSSRPARSPKILIYYQQFRLWAFFDYIGQIDNFVSKYSVVSMSIFMSGLSFGYSFLKVEETSLKRGTAAVLVANLVSFSFLYVISWDIERRSGRLHGILLSIASREYDLLIKRLWLKTLFGFFERDSRRTFTLADRYPLNLHSYFRTVLGWFGMSLLIFRLFHKPLWDSTFGGG